MLTIQYQTDVPRKTAGTNDKSFDRNELEISNRSVFLDPVGIIEPVRRGGATGRKTALFPQNFPNRWRTCS